MERYRVVQNVGVYFVTFTVVGWLPVFIEESPCQILIDSLGYCIRNEALRVNAYVIMPTHFHAVLFDEELDSGRLKSTLVSLRKFTARQLLDHCGEHAPSSFMSVFTLHAGNDRRHRFWQPTMHAESITTEPFWRQKVDYIHLNPCRSGLVRHPEDWRFSSASFWSRADDGAVDLELAELDW